MAQAEVDSLRHASARASVSVGMTRRQVGSQSLVAPASDPGYSVRRNVVRLPAIDDRTGKFRSAFRCEEHVARGVALAAMRQRACQISAAIPALAARCVELEASARKKKKLPAAHQIALVERKNQRVFGRRRAN